MRRILAFSFLSFFSFTLLAQKSAKIIYSEKPLQEVFYDLQERYDVVLSFTSDICDGIFVSESLDSKIELREVLNKILPPIRLQYHSFDEGYISISKAEAQELTLCGKVINQDGETLPYVNIYLPERKEGSTTDKDGNIKWIIKAYENELVEVSYLGHLPFKTTAEKLKNCPDIVLAPRMFSFEEVLIKEYVTTGIEQSIDMDHMILRPEKMNMVPGLTDADVLQLVQLLPGIRSIDESATGLHVKGGNPDQNLILYDNIPIYSGGHFFGMISGFNPALVNTVDVYQSGFGPEYGGRISSVIDIKSISTIPDQLQFDAGLNFTHGDISIALPLISKKVGLVLGTRKSYTEIVETPTYQSLSKRVFRRGKFEDINEQDEEVVVDFNLGFDFNDVNAKLLFDLSKKDKFSVSYLRINDNLNFLFQDNEDDFNSNDIIKQNLEGISSKWDRQWNKKLKSSISFSSSKQLNSYTFSIEDGDEGDEIITSKFNDIRDKTLNFDNEWNIFSNMNLEFGSQYADLSIERFYIFDEGEGDMSEFDKNKILTNYFSLNSILANKLNANFGLRWNYAFGPSKNSFEPRISLNYTPIEYFQIKYAVGLYQQFMSQVVEFNDLGINQDFWILADENEDIPTVKGRNAFLGFIVYPKAFMLEVEGFYKQQEGLTSNLSNFQVNGDNPFDSGSGHSYGVDILLKKRWSHLQSWISYSFNRSFYTTEIDDENDLTFSAPHDVPHNFRITGQYKKNNWNFSVSWNIASGIVFTPDNGLNDEEEPEPSYLLSEINSERLPTTHRLDFSVMYKLFERNGLYGNLGFSLLNVYNRENLMGREFFSIYDDDIEMFELQTRDRAMLGFTPNIVFRIGFE